jgi:hypothetical protein
VFRRSVVQATCAEGQLAMVAEYFDALADMQAAA